mgnify:CR=1 FL=1
MMKIRNTIKSNAVKCQAPILEKKGGKAGASNRPGQGTDVLWAGEKKIDGYEAEIELAGGSPPWPKGLVGR